MLLNMILVVSGLSNQLIIGLCCGYRQKAGIVLILRIEKDVKYWNKLNSVIENHNVPIDTWYITQ